MSDGIRICGLSPGEIRRWIARCRGPEVGGACSGNLQMAVDVGEDGQADGSYLGRAVDLSIDEEVIILAALKEVEG